MFLLAFVWVSDFVDQCVLYRWVCVMEILSPLCRCTARTCIRILWDCREMEEKWKRPFTLCKTTLDVSNSLFLQQPNQIRSFHLLLLRGFCAYMKTKHNHVHINRSCGSKVKHFTSVSFKSLKWKIYTIIIKYSIEE